jgi:hypothetical protein
MTDDETLKAFLALDDKREASNYVEWCYAAYEAVPLLRGSLALAWIEVKRREAEIMREAVRHIEQVEALRADNTKLREAATRALAECFGAPGDGNCNPDCAACELARLVK